MFMGRKVPLDAYGDKTFRRSIVLFQNLSRVAKFLVELAPYYAKVRVASIFLLADSLA